MLDKSSIPYKAKLYIICLMVTVELSRYI